MRNEEVIDDFVNGSKSGKTRNVFIEENVIYSYGYHFPMGIRLNDGYFIINNNKYSQSTSTHQNKLKGKIQEDKMIKKDTNYLKMCIEKRIIDMKELIIEGLDDE